jgi:RNA polymerase sigma factor FliA
MTPVEEAYKSSMEGIDERNELVISELPQVYYIAARIRERLPQHVEMEDLVHAGVIGLIEACRSYDSTLNTQFSTFAKFRIRGAIMDSLRKLDWGSRALRKQGRAITSSIAKLASSLGRYPIQEEIAADLGMTLDQLHDNLAQLDGLFLVGQQSETSHDGGESHDLIESAPSRGGDNPFDLCLEGERQAHLLEATSKLSEREQMILSLYYHEELTMKEIAEVVEIAVSRVSQIHAAALLKLKLSLSHINKRKGTPSNIYRPSEPTAHRPQPRRHA